MNKKEIIEKVGKMNFFANDYTLAAELKYISGILLFDKYFAEKSTKNNEVIHLTKYPNGLIVKIAKIFSSILFGFAFSEINRVVLSDKSIPNILIFELKNNEKITFTLKNIFKVREFLDEIHLKYDFETKVEKITRTPHSKTTAKTSKLKSISNSKTNSVYNQKYLKK